MIAIPDMLPSAKIFFRGTVGSAAFLAGMLVFAPSSVAQAVKLTHYAQVKGWSVEAIAANHAFAFCTATTVNRGHHMRIAFDGQDWAVGGEADGNNVRARLAIDTREETVLFQSSGLNDGWLYTKIASGGLDLLRNGSVLKLNLGKSRMVPYSLSGSAAAMLKLQECVQRKGVAPKPKVAMPSAPVPAPSGGFGAGFKPKATTTFGAQAGSGQVQPMPMPRPKKPKQGVNSLTTQVGKIAPTKRLKDSGLTYAEAKRLIRVVGGKPTSLPAGCSWVINDALFPDKRDVLLYYAASCQGKTSKLKRVPGGRKGRLDVAASAFAGDPLRDMTGEQILTVGSGHETNPGEYVLFYAREVIANKADAQRCTLQSGASRGHPADSFVVALDAKAANDPRYKDHEYPCGAFGIGGTSNFWRVMGGWSFFFHFGQDFVRDIDARSLTVISKQADGRWRVMK